METCVSTLYILHGNKEQYHQVNSCFTDLGKSHTVFIYSVESDDSARVTISGGTIISLFGVDELDRSTQWSQSS
jgi:hypothetical protein